MTRHRPHWSIDVAAGWAALAALLALSVAVVVALTLLLLPPARAGEPPPLVFGPYRVVELVRVVDGDTYDMRLATFPSFALHGDPDSRTVRVRLRGGDTPEVRRGPPCEREAGKRATDRARALLDEADVVVVDKLQPDGLGRMVGTVYVKGPSGVARNLAAVLVHEGHAREWTAGYQPWC